MIVVCAVCAATVLDGDRFCEQCGARVELPSSDLGCAAAVTEQILACELPDDVRARATESLTQPRLAAASAKETAPLERKDLWETLQDENPEKRREAMRVIVEQGLRITHEGSLLRLLADRDETVRLYAIRLVVRDGNPEHAWILDLLLFHPDDRSKSEVVVSI